MALDAELASAHATPGKPDPHHPGVPLAIEHNTPSLDQVTAVIDGKPVLGLPVDPGGAQCLCRL